MPMTIAEQSPVKQHCNSCLGWKNHDVVHEETSSWTEVFDGPEGISISGGHVWTIYRCRGCDDVRMKHAHWFSEDMDADGSPVLNEEWFPPSINRQKPKWIRSLLPFNLKLVELRGLTLEIYGALAIGAHRVATMGIRALVERLMIDVVGDKGTFKATVRAFFEAGYVAPFQRAMFENTLIEAGHAAMHRDFMPSAEDVNTLLDIVESVLDAVYYQPMSADAVRKSIPSRGGGSTA